MQEGECVIGVNVSMFADKLEAVCKRYGVLCDRADDVLSADSYVITRTRISGVVRRPQSRIGSPELLNYQYRMVGMLFLSCALSRLSSASWVRRKGRRRRRRGVPRSPNDQCFLHLTFKIYDT